MNIDIPIPIYKPYNIFILGLVNGTMNGYIKDRDKHGENEMTEKSFTPTGCDQRADYFNLLRDFVDAAEKATGAYHRREALIRVETMLDACRTLDKNATAERLGKIVM